MSIESILTAVGGVTGLVYLIYWLLTNRKKTDVTGKVVLVTGANSGLGKGNSCS